MTTPTVPPLPCNACLEQPAIVDAGDHKAVVVCLQPGCKSQGHKSIAQVVPDAIAHWNHHQWGDQLLLMDLPKTDWPSVNTPGRGFGVGTPLPCD